MTTRDLAGLPCTAFWTPEDWERFESAHPDLPPPEALEVFGHVCHREPTGKYLHRAGDCPKCKAETWGIGLRACDGGSK